jgi:ADP-ribosylglycohydrolase
VTRADRIRGCLLGGAVGDALGAGAITADTQMTLFTVEGLIRAQVRGANKGICHPPSVVDHAYARWLATQGERSPRWRDAPDGWLIGVRALHDRRAPGATCLAALRAPRMGTVEAPLNDSKGRGAVMRIAPVGLLGGDRFDLACDVAALTHGHPTGYLAAGAFAEILARVVDGASLPAALDAAERRLRERPGHEETLAALRAARTRAPGGGRVAEEALAIAVRCALAAESFEHGVRLAVDHGTGALAGNLLGALHGAGAIPAHRLAQLELRAEIEALSADLLACFGAEPSADLYSPAWWARYPGW